MSRHRVLGHQCVFNSLLWCLQRCFKASGGSPALHWSHGCSDSVDQAAVQLDAHDEWWGALMACFVCSEGEEVSIPAGSEGCLFVPHYWASAFGASVGDLPQGERRALLGLHSFFAELPSWVSIIFSVLSSANPQQGTVLNVRKSPFFFDSSDFFT